MLCCSASVFIIVVTAVLKMVASFVSYSFSVAPIFDGILSCMTFTFCVNAAIIVSAFVCVGTAMYWCLKKTVSGTHTLLVFLTQFCDTNNAFLMFQCNIFLWHSHLMFLLCLVCHVVSMHIPLVQASYCCNPVAHKPIFLMLCLLDMTY